MITDMQRAIARQALVPLNANYEFVHKSPQLRRWFPASVLADIKAQVQEAKAFNKDAEKVGGALLTPEAGAYWEEVQLLLKRGKAAQAHGVTEKEISVASEKLMESFDARVPEHDKPKFLHLDLQRHAETWDDRWSFIEFPAPLLQEELSFQHRIHSVANYAQRQVLTVLAQPPYSQEDEERRRANGRKLRQLALEERGEKLTKQLKRMFAANTSPERKKAISKDRKEAAKRMGIGKPKRKLKIDREGFDKLAAGDEQSTDEPNDTANR